MKKFIAIIAIVATMNSFAATMTVKEFNAAVDAAVEFITAKESFRTSWYDDATGKSIASKTSPCKGTATIGHGLTGAYWHSNTITKEQSLAIVKKIVAADAKKILLAMKNKPTKNNLAALCSLAYRRGVDPVIRSKTFQAVNDRNWKVMNKQWKEFNTSGGVVMPGLNKRCLEEIRLFFK